MTSFVELLEQYFQETAHAEGTEVRHFKIGGRAVSFQFAGTRWVKEMTNAIAHLESAAGGGLNVSMWDGARAPKNHLLRAYLFTLTNWWFDYTGPRGELLDIHGGELSATYHPPTGTLSVVDMTMGEAFYWKQDASPMPYYESCYPFRALLHPWMRSSGRYFIHGAAVGLPEGGVILSGKSGSGKSTTALSCLRSSLKLAGDENCLVHAKPEGGFDVHGLYCTAKVVELKNLDAFPGISAPVVNPHREAGEKVAISLFDHRAEMIQQFPLRAILVPVVTRGRETRIVPCSAHEALMAVAPETLSQLPASGRADLKFLGELVRRVPCFHILLGTNLAEVPGKIAALLHSLGVPAPMGESTVATVR
jgi:hypothetical protein